MKGYPIDDIVDSLDDSFASVVVEAVGCFVEKAVSSPLVAARCLNVVVDTAAVRSVDVSCWDETFVERWRNCGDASAVVAAFVWGGIDWVVVVGS